MWVPNKEGITEKTCKLLLHHIQPASPKARHAVCWKSPLNRAYEARWLIVGVIREQEHKRSWKSVFLLWDQVDLCLTMVDLSPIWIFPFVGRRVWSSARSRVLETIVNNPFPGFSTTSTNRTHPILWNAHKRVSGLRCSLLIGLHVGTLSPIIAFLIAVIAGSFLSLSLWSCC